MIFSVNNRIICKPFIKKEEAPNEKLAGLTKAVAFIELEVVEHAYDSVSPGNGDTSMRTLVSKGDLVYVDRGRYETEAKTKVFSWNQDGNPISVIVINLADVYMIKANSYKR